jgi:hypothetical protein
MNVKPPSARLPSWSRNVGQGDRNVLELSHPMLEISWIEWQLMKGPESKMGTYTTTDLSYSSPRLYQYLMSVLETKTPDISYKTNVKLIIEDDDEIDEIENEEKSLLLRLEKIQKMKKINQLKNDKNDLLEKIKTLTNLVNNIDTQIEELTNFS